MNNSPIHEEIFDRYLLDEMSEKEKKDFEVRLHSDADFRKSFNVHQKMFWAIQMQGIKNDLKQIHTEAEKKKIIPFYRKPWAVAAAVIALAAISIIAIQFYTQTPSYENLYQAYYYKDDGVPITMGVGNDPQFSRAMNAYKSDDLPMAKKHFMKLLETEPKNDTLNYYMGMSELQSKDYKAAMLYLYRVPSVSSLFSNRNYFLGLIHLKKENKDSALFYLQQTDNPKASSLVHQLK